MNVVISDTAEYGCYLFDQAARPLLKDFVENLNTDVIGVGMTGNAAVDNRRLIEVNAEIRSHSVEVVGARLRGYMTGMKAIISSA
jgi:ketol-acid reductoisomerase